MAKISDTSKHEMVKGFGFTDSELSQIENFINEQGGKTAKETLDDLIKSKKLNSKQKILISYVIGNYVAHYADDQSGHMNDMEFNPVPFAG